MQLKTKLSAAEILGNVVDIVKNMDIGDKVQAYALGGLCEAYETGVSTFGEWIRFVGEMQALNYTTGEQVRATKAHIPEVLQDLLMAGIRDSAEIVASKATKTTQYYKLATPIEFSYKVDIIRMPDDEKEGIKYKYVVSPLTDVVENDKLQHLTSLFPAQTAPKALNSATKSRTKKVDKTEE